MIATTIPPGVSPYLQRSVGGRYLVSIQDFMPEELACALELATAMKARPSDYRPPAPRSECAPFRDTDWGGSPPVRRPAATFRQPGLQGSLTTDSLRQAAVDLMLTGH